MLACVLASLPLALLGCRDTLDPFTRLPSGSEAQLVAVADTVLPAADTYIRQTLPNTNWGTDTMLQVGGGGKNRVLVRLDSAAIRSAVGAGTLDSAWVEFTITSYPRSGWGDNGRTVDLHRLLKTWTEDGATWNCAIDLEPQNSSANCPSTGWDMTNNGNGTYVSTKTDRVTLVNNQTGIIRLNVTADVQGFLDGTFVHQGWMFRKTNEATGGEALVLSRESGSKPRLVLSVQSSSVPASAPDSIPATVYQAMRDTTRWIYSDSTIGGDWPREYVVVVFLSSASQSQRQAAINAVSGTVVGGLKGTGQDGFYVVRLPDDGTAGPVINALQVLDTMPGVASVTPALFGSPSYVRPQDGAGWQRADWEAVPSRAGGVNWHLEAIAAPLAWGCTTGDSNARVAVIDRGFRQIVEVKKNINSYYNWTLLPLSTVGEDHGAGTSALIGARGNDSIGIAGVAWYAYLQPFLVTGPPGNRPNLMLEIGQLIGDASRDQARVVNISHAYNWLTSGRLPLPRDSHVVNRTYRSITAYLTNHVRGPLPLLVIAAGNDDTLDAKWQILPQLALYDSLSVLVVQASDSSGGIWREAFGTSVGKYGSSVGSLVSIDAPGAKITTYSWDPALSRVDIVEGGSGTSLAAPLVSGTAALLLGINPNFTAHDLRRLILTGAQRGGVTVAGKRRLNAGESVRAAAEETSGSLCGNRVWGDGKKLMVSRGASSTILYQAPDTVALVRPYHGGRRIDFIVNGIGDRSLVYNGTTWLETSPDSAPPALLGATWNSVFAQSHDGDSIGYALTTPTAAGRTLTASYGTAFAVGRLLDSLSIPLIAGLETASVRASLDAANRRLLVLVNRNDVVGAATIPQRAEVYEFPLAGGSHQLLSSWTRNGQTLHWLGVAENGDSAVMATTDVADPTHPCRIEYFALAAPSNPVTVIANPVACGAKGTGVFAPLRRTNRRH